jgi:hypothetical protein
MTVTTRSVSMKSDFVKAKEIWWHLNNKKKLMGALDLEDVLPITHDVAICILANPGIRLEDVIKQPYFKGQSRSTLKRAVAYLLTHNYVLSNQSRIDGRAYMLRFNLYREGGNYAK